MQIAFADNTSGSAIAFNNGVLTVHTSVALAPGSPVRLRMLSDPPLELEGRTVTARRDEHGGFTVQIRLVNLRREVRQILETSLSSAPRTAVRTVS